MSFSFHPYFGVTHLPFSSAASSSRFGKICKFSTRRIGFIDFHCLRLTTADIVHTCSMLKTSATFQPNFALLSNVLNNNYVNLLVTMRNHNWPVSLPPSLSYAPRWVVLHRYNASPRKQACLWWIYDKIIHECSPNISRDVLSHKP